MRKHNYNLVLAHSSGKSRSRYSGGFTTVNGRLNNSSAYNHDYYMKNKDKWEDNRVRNSGAKRITPISEVENEKAYYENLGEDNILEGWDEDKFMYARNHPDFQKAYSDWEYAQDLYESTGKMRYKIKADEAGVRSVDELLRIGDEYDRARGIESRRNSKRYHEAVNSKLGRSNGKRRGSFKRGSRKRTSTEYKQRYYDTAKERSRVRTSHKTRLEDE